MPKIDVILDIANKQLCEIPRYILEMKNLKMLYLEGNALEVVPEDIFTELTNLVWLDLRNNKLKTIPQTIAQHACLETLLLRDNEIQMLPLELGLVPNLKVLQISGNPIIYPKKEIIQEGVQAITNYLKQEYESTKIVKEPPKEKYQSEIKCVVTNKPKKPRDGMKYHKPVLKLTNYKESKSSLGSSHCKGALHKGCGRVHNSYSRSSSIYKDSMHHNSNKYVGLRPSRKNDIRIEDAYFKELWMKKLQGIMLTQEEELQRQK